MVGQKNLLAKLEQYTLATLPRTILFIGEEGSGKHTIVKHLANKFELEIVDVPVNIEPELLIEYQQCPIRKIYYINLMQYTQKQQNQILKFIEEPGKNVYIMLSSENEILVLPTILNRCMKLHMEPYSEAELRYVQICNEPLVYKLCTTPGQVLMVDYKRLPNLYTVANKIVTDLDRASYANTLSLAARINYKENYDKFDFKLFLRAIEYAAMENYKQTKLETSFRVYQITNNYKQQLVDKTIIKENFILNYLTNLWQEIHG